MKHSSCLLYNAAVLLHQTVECDSGDAGYGDTGCGIRDAGYGIRDTGIFFKLILNFDDLNIFFNF